MDSIRKSEIYLLRKRSNSTGTDLQELISKENLEELRNDSITNSIPKKTMSKRQSCLMELEDLRSRLSKNSSYRESHISRLSSISEYGEYGDDKEYDNFEGFNKDIESGGIYSNIDLSKYIYESSENIYESVTDSYRGRRLNTYKRKSEFLYTRLAPEFLLEDDNSKYYFRNKVNKKIQYLYVLLMLYLLPFSVISFLPIEHIKILYWISLSSIIFTNFLIFLELAYSYKTWKMSKKRHQSKINNDLELKLVALVPAYLPNEIKTLKDTLEAMTQIFVPSKSNLIIIICHNGGNSEQRLKLLNMIDEIKTPQNIKIIELYVLNSSSKAQNVNAAIDFLIDNNKIEPDICAIYDADHQPDPYAYYNSIRTIILTGCDIVQGRCCINRGSVIISTEFDILYSIHHAGGYLLKKFGIFGGSNGYWLFPLLKLIRMDEGMLTEDIDSAFRSLAIGANIVFDPLVVSCEEAPPSMAALIKQRLRWAQGWSQVSQKNLKILWNPKLSIYKRIMIFIMLHWREVYYYISSLAFPSALIYFIKCGFCMDYTLLGFTIIQSFMSVILLIASILLVGKKKHPKLTSKVYLFYAIIVYFYDTLKIYISILGHYRNIMGMTRWKVTKRSSPDARLKT